MILTLIVWCALTKEVLLDSMAVIDFEEYMYFTVPGEDALED